MTHQVSIKPIASLHHNININNRRICRATIVAGNGLNAVAVDLTRPGIPYVRYTVNCNVNHVDFGLIRELEQHENLTYHYRPIDTTRLPTKQQLFAALSKVLDAKLAARLMPELRI